MSLRALIEKLLTWEPSEEPLQPDPIELLSGHVCGPDCWHSGMREMFRDMARRDKPASKVRR